MVSKCTFIVSFRIKRSAEHAMSCATDEGYLYVDTTFGDIASFFFALSATIAFFGNIFCLVVLWQPSQRSKVNKILTSLAISDCMSGLISIPYVIYMLQHGHTQADMACWRRSLMSVIIIWSISSSAHTILLITYDRYLLITRPSRYNELLSNRKVNFIIIFIWVASLPRYIQEDLQPKCKYVNFNNAA